MSHNLQELLDQTVELVKKTAQFVQSTAGNDLQVEEKSRNSLVTYVDKESEKRLVEGLTTILPEAGIIGEEGVANRKSDTYNWIIDPIDGTTNFIHGLPCYSISVALANNEDILLGVVYEISSNQCFSARKGGGAFLNEQKIVVSQRVNFSDTLLATGFPYRDYDNLNNYLDLLKDLMKQTRGLRRFGSAAVDLAYVACGKYDAFYEYGLSPWDVAAGILLVQEAGGKVSDFKGEKNYLFGNQILAASTYTHEDLLILIQKHFN